MNKNAAIIAINCNSLIYRYFGFSQNNERTAAELGMKKIPGKKQKESNFFHSYWKIEQIIANHRFAVIFDFLKISLHFTN